MTAGRRRAPQDEVDRHREQRGEEEDQDDGRATLLRRLPLIGGERTLRVLRVRTRGRSSLRGLRRARRDAAQRCLGGRLRGREAQRVATGRRRRRSGEAAARRRVPRAPSDPARLRIGRRFDHGKRPLVRDGLRGSLQVRERRRFARIHVCGDGDLRVGDGRLRRLGQRHRRDVGLRGVGVCADEVALARRRRRLGRRGSARHTRAFLGVSAGIHLTHGHAPRTSRRHPTPSSRPPASPSRPEGAHGLPRRMIRRRMLKRPVRFSRLC